jgi:methionyl-tRNA formyltransferase
MTNTSQAVTSSKSRVVFFGNERLVSGLPTTKAPILNGLIERGYDVVAVVSHYADTQSRTNRELEVAAIAKTHNIPLFLPNRPSEIVETLRSLKADIAVLVAYGRIISQEVIDIFPKGIINIHPSLLPQYRGPTPIETAILNGDKETGVSIMRLTAGMDEGPVYAQQSVLIAEDETKLHLYERIVNASTQLFFDTFPKILDDSLQPTPQDSHQTTYTHLIKKSDGVIDWHNKTAEQIEREIRAYEGWPQSRTVLGGIDAIITATHVIPYMAGIPGQITVTTQNGVSVLAVAAREGALSVDALKPLGKKEMPIGAFLAGYKSKIVQN